MQRVLTSGRKGMRIALASGVLLWTALAVAGGIDSSFSAWLGREMPAWGTHDHVGSRGRDTIDAPADSRAAVRARIGHLDRA